ncbi:MAG: fatty acid desaturase [Actinomycetota bacterium]
MTDTAPVQTHDSIVDRMTGGMVPDGLVEFAGSERLRPDGRPRPELRRELRQISDGRNVITSLVALLAPVVLVALVVAIDHWLAIVAGIFFMAVLQNRLFLLHHEGAHRLLFRSRRWNDLIGVVLFGWLAFGTGTHSYRRAHTNHHRDEFGPKEPDFLLYALYPIRLASMRRKLRRDLSGVSAYRILRPRLTGLFKRRYWRNSARFLLGQAFVFSLFALAGRPWLYLFLWVMPYVFVYQVINRLRAIAEHGGMTRSSDRRATSHHVHQSLLARSIMVPCGIGYHLAHHVDSGIPFRNLARYTQILEEDGYITPDMTWPSYRALWKALASQ